MLVNGLMEPDTPNEVRTRILAQHDLLRLRLDGLARGVDQLRRERLEIDELRLLAWETLALLRAHVRDEERWLVPVLEHVDGFGPARVAALQREHRTQAREMSETLDVLRSASSPEALAKGIEALIHRILDDMEEEEESYLHPAVLNDDAV